MSGILRARSKQQAVRLDTKGNPQLSRFGLAEVSAPGAARRRFIVRIAIRAPRKTPTPGHEAGADFVQSSMTKSAETPARFMAQFSEYMNAGDLDNLMGLYEPDAVFMPEPGAVLRGHDAIRGALAQLLALRPRMQTEVEHALESGDIALVQVRWQLHGTAPDGSAIEQGGLSADVLRRHADGCYRVVIDRP